MAKQENGVDTITPSKPGEQSAEEMASVSATTDFVVSVNTDVFNHLFVYKYAKNMFGIISQAKIDAYRETWLNQHINTMLANESKQIRKQIRNKQILAEHEQAVNGKALTAAVGDEQ